MRRLKLKLVLRNALFLFTVYFLYVISYEESKISSQLVSYYNDDELIIGNHSNGSQVLGYHHLNVQLNHTQYSQISNLTYLKKINKKQTIVFLHIGKSAGTSFDKMMASQTKKLKIKYIGHKHFDWSYIDKLDKVNVFTILRNPVERSVSHFWFAKSLSWTRKSPVRQQNLTQFLSDPQTMLDIRGVWQDGQAGVSWLTGTHIASWVSKISASQKDKLEEISLNMTYMCSLAAKRLESTSWFGIFEDFDRSLEMLQWQLGSSKLIISKSNTHKHKDATATEKKTLASLMPQDIWLYDYAKLLFEARWILYKTGVWIPPLLPEIPKPTCQSTRFSIYCSEGPLAPIRYFDPNIPSSYHHYFDIFL